MSSQRAKTIDLDVYLEKALFGPIEIEDIHSLSLSTRCALIKRLLEASKNSKPSQSKDMSEVSLARLSKTFEISEGFHDWQRRKRKVLIRELKQRRNKPILTGFRNWRRLSTTVQKFVLRKSVQLHRKIYIEGVTEKLPYTHNF